MAKKKSMFFGVPNEPNKIVILTNSTNSSWNVHPNSTLPTSTKWKVTGGAFGTYYGSEPLIDLSGNTGIATITITNSLNNLKDNFTLSPQINSGITSIDFVGEDIGCTSLLTATNPITSLNVSKLPRLSVLNVSSTDLTSIDVTNNLLLTSLTAQSGDLTTLDVSNNILLETLYFNGNNISGAIDLSNNDKLTYVNGAQNSGMTSINLSNLSLVTELQLSLSSGISTLDVSDMTSLETLVLNNSTLNTLTLGTISAMTYLKVDVNNLSSLDLSNLTALTYLQCNNNQLTSLTLTNNTALVTLIAGNQSGAGLTSIDISTLASLETFNAQFGADLNTVGDLTNNTSLRQILVRNGNLSGSEINNIILDLDANNLLVGDRDLDYQSNTGSPTATESVTDDVLDAYNNLIANGWTITGDVPS